LAENKYHSYYFFYKKNLARQRATPAEVGQPQTGPGFTLLRGRTMLSSEPTAGAQFALANAPLRLQAEGTKAEIQRDTARYRLEVSAPIANNTALARNEPQGMYIRQQAPTRSAPSGIRRSPPACTADLSEVNGPRRPMRATFFELLHRGWCGIYRDGC
jgi:hypothetical protein